MDCTIKVSMKDVIPTWEELSILRIALFDGDDSEILEKAKAEFKERGRIEAIDIQNELHVLNELI